MKRVLTLSLLLWSFIAAQTQNYPSEWNVYTSEQYFCAIENGINEQNIPEENFRNNLLDLARFNLAKQIQVKVHEESRTDKRVVNGISSITYISRKNLSTDVDMNLAKTLSHYNDNLGKYYVITYINKKEACTFYENEIMMLLKKVGNCIAIADDYINKGFKTKAKNELHNALSLIDNVGKPFFWFNVFGLEENTIRQYLLQVHDNEQTVKSKLADLEYGTTYCVLCKADNFGKAYPKLENEIKGELSASGCNFVDDPDSADYVIRVDASSREYNAVRNTGGSAFFSYVDVTVSIDKKATQQRIFEDEISVKGSHTLSYDEAGRDGFKNISKKISKMLKENIKL